MQTNLKTIHVSTSNFQYYQRYNLEGQQYSLKTFVRIKQKIEIIIYRCEKSKTKIYFDFPK